MVLAVLTSCKSSQHDFSKLFSCYVLNNVLFWCASYILARPKVVPVLTL